MFYRVILCQVIVGEEYKLCKFNIDLHKYNMYEYSKINDEELDKKELKRDYINNWFKKVLNKDTKTKIIIEQRDGFYMEDKDIHFDITIDEKQRIIKEGDMVKEGKYDELEDKQNISINDYDEDETEYCYTREMIEKEREEYYNKNYKDIYERMMERAKTEEEKYNIDIELFGPIEEEGVYDVVKVLKKKEILNRLTDEYKENKLKDIEKKMDIYKYLARNNESKNRSYAKYCKCKYATQLYRRFRYKNWSELDIRKYPKEDEEDYIYHIYNDNVVDENGKDVYLEEVKDNEKLQLLEGDEREEYKKEIRKKKYNKNYDTNEDIYYKSLFFVLKKNLVVSSIDEEEYSGHYKKIDIYFETLSGSDMGYISAEISGDRRSGYDTSYSCKLEDVNYDLGKLLAEEIIENML